MVAYKDGSTDLDIAPVPTAGEQVKGLEAKAQKDTGAPAAPVVPTDAPVAPEQSQVTKEASDWKQDVSKIGVDPGWVIQLRKKLLETGKIGGDALSVDKLADPEYRAWLNKQLKTEVAANNEAEKPVKPAEKPTSPAGGGRPPVPGNPPPSVLKPGHLPTVPQWNEGASATPWPGPSTPIPTGGGGPKATRSASVQATALSRSGDVYPENKG